MNYLRQTPKAAEKAVVVLGVKFISLELARYEGREIKKRQGDGENQRQGRARILC